MSKQPLTKAQLKKQRLLAKAANDQLDPVALAKWRSGEYDIGKTTMLHHKLNPMMECPI